MSRVLPPCKTQELVALYGYSLSLISFFILSTCCITVLDIPGFINRTAFWQGGKQRYPKRIRSIVFIFVSFVSPLVLFYFYFSLFPLISRTAIRDVHCCNGWLFCLFPADGVLCFQLVSMILLPPFGRSRRSAVFINDHRECA